MTDAASNLTSALKLMCGDGEMIALDFSARQKVILMQIPDPCCYYRNIWLAHRLHLRVHFVELGDLFPDTVVPPSHMLAD